MPSLNLTKTETKTCWGSFSKLVRKSQKCWSIGRLCSHARPLEAHSQAWRRLKMLGLGQLSRNSFKVMLCHKVSSGSQSTGFRKCTRYKNNSQLASGAESARERSWPNTGWKLLTGVRDSWLGIKSRCSRSFRGRSSKRLASKYVTRSYKKPSWSRKTSI